MIGKRFRSLPFIFANDNYTLSSYNDTFVEKTDAPQELKNEFIENPDMYTALSNADTKAKADAILNENSTDSALTVERCTILGGSFK